MTSIAILDVIGAPYDGATLSKRGLGGSESAIVLMSRELVKLGFKVQVFNNCIDNGVMPGVYDGVEYIHLSELDEPNNYTADVVISSRTVIPFLHPNLWKEFPELHPERFKQFKQNAKLRVVWMHDTFCKGDHLLEPMVTHGDIHELFTLSDFHTSYITTCNHGNRRMFEVLKKHIFMTRNGIVKYHDEVDISAKDPYLYVYNSSVTKGMVPLVEDIWPQIKQRIPQARLKVIGGFYVFKDAKPDEQELTWRRLAADPKNAELDIEFTGILRQSEIADVLANASYMIYPSIFPETFGISVLESLAYNTPLITTRFGALEETAVETAAWMMDYPVEPNNVFPNIDKAHQTAKFVDLAVHATENRYLHQQKMYYCNIVKDICTWDTVALQWKQHLVKRLGGYLPVEEYRKVSEINTRVHQVFGRRFTNKEEIYLPRKTQQRIVVISPVYNASAYIEQCIQSVISQDYDNYHMYIIDDASTDNTYELALKYASERVTVLRNKQNQGAVYNQITVITENCFEDDIIMLLDGDDSLVNNNQIFHYYNNLYDGSTEFTYGSCWSMIDNIPLIAQHYPNDVKQRRAYRQHKFNWNMPYTHLRTFKGHLLNEVSFDNFKDSHGNWYRAGGDGSVFYTLIERADPNKVKAVADIVVNYNDKNPLNDYKVNSAEQTRNAEKILGTKIDGYSIIVPTMWRINEMFLPFLKKLAESALVDEIIIINNAPEATPTLPNSDKIKMLTQGHNIYVNPAFNLGVAHSRNSRLCFLGDDVEFDLRLLEVLYDKISPQVGVFGLCPGEPYYNQPPVTDGSIDIIPWSGQIIHGFGCLMFLDKANWIDIPQDLKLYYGENFIFDLALQRGQTNYLITNLHFNTPYAATVSDTSISGGMLEREGVIYDSIKHNLQALATGAVISTDNKIKTILIAIPTARNIEARTFKSIYDLTVPEGYTTEFQFFYGYQVDQVRNLIASWAERYDYLFSVDSDIVFPPDTLARLLAHRKDIVSGLYIQRKPGQHILEIYKGNDYGGVTNIPWSEIKGQGLVEIQACGFGCVLINSQVFRDVGYPYFKYYSALDHKDTISEDVDFCAKARNQGYKLYADTAILCEHLGTTSFKVE